VHLRGRQLSAMTQLEMSHYRPPSRGHLSIRSEDKFWIAAARWLKEKQKPQVGVEYSSRLEFFAFKAVVVGVEERQSITLKNLETGEARKIDLRGADIRLVQKSDPAGRIRDLSFAPFVCVFRMMWEDDETDARCTLTELRDLGKPV